MIGDVQITEIAYKVEDMSTGEIVETVYDKIALRKDSFLSPYALHVNRSDILTNPEGRITEYEAAKKLEAVCKKYSVQDGGRTIKPVFTAYNGTTFDKPLIDKLMRRAGIRPSEVFNKTVCDPHKYALNLKTQKKLTTPLTPKQKQPTTKLSAIADMYKVNSSGAHNAMADVDMMIQVSNKMFRDLTGKDMKDIVEPMPSVYEAGKVYKVTSSTGSGITEREILVLNNDLDNNKLHVLDGKTVGACDGKFKEDTIREFNYDSIIEDKMPAVENKQLMDFYKSHQDKIDAEIIKNATRVKNRVQERVDSDKDSDDMEPAILRAEAMLVQGRNPRDVLQSLKDEGLRDEQASFAMNFANKKCLIKGIDTQIDSNRYERLSPSQLKALAGDLKKLEGEFDETNPANPSIQIIYQDLKKYYPHDIPTVAALEKVIGTDKVGSGARWCRKCGKPLLAGEGDIGPDCMAAIAKAA
jgi:hypothetical protein